MGAVRSMVRHPSLWGEGVRALAATAPDGWWRRFPFLPRPDPAHLAWRLSTAYGVGGARLGGEDLVRYLAWRKRQRRR